MKICGALWFYEIKCNFNQSDYFVVLSKINEIFYLNQCFVYPKDFGQFFTMIRERNRF